MGATTTQCYLECWGGGDWEGDVSPKKNTIPKKGTPGENVLRKIIIGESVEEN